MNNLKQLPDEQLVALYAGGNNSAFDTLLERHKDKLFNYILFSIKNDDEANDIFQDTFVKAIMTIRQGRYTESGKFYPWLTRIAHNLIVDRFRQDANENTISNDEIEADLYNEAAIKASTAPTDDFNEEVLGNVKELMNQLPEEQRQVVYMRIYQDLSFKEIAEETGVSINTALGRMRYATINMRRMANESRLFD